MEYMWRTGIVLVVSHAPCPKEMVYRRAKYFLGPSTCKHTYEKVTKFCMVIKTILEENFL